MTDNKTDKTAAGPELRAGFVRRPAGNATARRRRARRYINFVRRNRGVPPLPGGEGFTGDTTIAGRVAAFQ